ncbi:MAG: ABC transporter permease [bacterium]|nr:ABC transporter permease [bacterium]
MFDTVIQSIFSAAFLAAILRVTTPILLPSLGALISDRAGVINIGLEGLMLSAAFTGAVVSAYAGPVVGTALAPWVGLITACGVSVSLALLLGVFHLRFKGDLILSGVAINVLGSAATVAILFELTGNRGDSGDLASFQMPFVQLPEFINSIPVIGGFLFTVFDNQSIMTWLAFLSVIAVWFVLYRTPFGMHLRAAGENPSAAESVGIRVTRVRYAALALSGLFAGFGGVHLSMGYLSLFQRDMTSGRGFIALATPLLGGSNPVGTGIASLVFGFFDALAIRIGSLQIPSMLPQMIPFIAVVMALVIYALQTRQVLRVRALRASQGEGFKAAYWRVVQRLSVLHVLLAMIAVIGIIITISLWSAPNGFGGPETAFPLGLGIGLASALLIAINLPFLIRVQRITHQAVYSAAAAGLSMAVYFGLFLALFFDSIPALVFGLLIAVFVWLILGGWRLLGSTTRQTAAVS